MSDKLLNDIKSSIMDMQSHMQSTYSDLSTIKLSGKSHDGSVEILMTATYAFEDIIFGDKALEGGIKEFKWRVREAWKDLSEKIQKTTQNKTMELLQGMDIPDDIRNMDIGLDEDGAEGGRTSGAIGN